MNLFEEKKTPYGLMFLNCMTNLWSLYTENDNHMQVKITIYKHNILINMWFAICRSYNVALIKKRTTHLVNWKKNPSHYYFFFGSTKNLIPTMNMLFHSNNYCQFALCMQCFTLIKFFCTGVVFEMARFSMWD